MKLGARLGAGLRKLVDLQPLTLSGFIAGLGGYVALFHYGLQRLDFVLLILGGAMFGLTGVALVSTLTASMLIAIRGGESPLGEDGLAPLEGECEYWVRTGYRLPRRRWLPFSTVAWEWVEPRAELKTRIDGPVLEEWVFVRRRGIYESLRRRFDVGDVFGLTRLRFESAEDRRMRFLPSVGGLERVDVIRGVSGGDDFAHPEGPQSGSPYDLRPYAPGDPLRFILWKVFARTRELVVRAPERALSPAQQAVAYLVTDPRDEPAAGTARAAVDVGALGEGWLFGADGSEQDASDQREALDLLTRSATAGADAGGSGLANFLARSSAGGEQRAVVFVPPRRGPWLDRVLNAFDGRRGLMEFVVCVDGAKQEQKRSRGLKKWMWGEDPASAQHDDWAEVLEVVKALRGPNARVLVIDRRNGGVFADTHLEKMAQEAA
jgi:hypothetical protein